MTILLVGGRIIDPSQGINDRLDLMIDQGRIAKIGKDLPEPGAESLIIDVTGCIIAPGLIDMHTHLREPGFEYKETIHSGCDAAVAGGFTSIACMPNTSPVNDNRSITEFIKRKAAEAGLAHVYPIASISRKSEGAVLAEFQDLKDAGAIGFSDDGKPVMNSALMRRALEYAGSLGLPIISHCEDACLSAEGTMNEGFVSTELGLAGIPSVAEDVMVARDILLAEYTRTAVHIAHVSSAGAVLLIRQAKQRGVSVTAETAPHYFSLTEEAVRGFGTNTKVNPPLRSPEDVAALKEGLKDGTIDVIASDHAPHAITDKDVEFDYASCGIVGLETSLALSLRLVEEGALSPGDLIEKMSTKPARILRIAGGTLREGSQADVTVIDTEKPWIVDASVFHSKGRNSPFQGWTLRGKAVLTIVGGAIKYREL